MLTYLSSYLAMASAFYYVIFEGVMSIIDPGFHDYFIPHSFDVSAVLLLVWRQDCYRTGLNDTHRVLDGTPF
jgi:hypothetical protein